MKLSAFMYSVRQGLKNIWRNKIFSLASVATMICCIMMFGIFYAIVANMNHVVQEAEQGVAVVVYFDEGTTEEQVAAIGDQIRAKTDIVSEVEYVSAEEAWIEFVGDYFKDNPELASGFEQDNPLANSNHYSIYLNDVAKQDELVKEIEQMEGVQRVDSNQMVADVLSDFNAVLGYFSMGIVVLLLAVAVFLISNTVAVGISVRKNEIGIMKLIGATDFFVRAPFVIEGVVIGLVGSLLPITILYFIYKQVVQFVEMRFGFLTGIISFLPAGQIFGVLLPVGLLIGIGIGFLGSFLTIRKHLRV